MAFNLSKLYKSLAHIPIIVVEHNPSSKWTILDIKLEHVYKHKSPFALKASTIFLDNKSVASIPSDD